MFTTTPFSSRREGNEINDFSRHGYHRILLALKEAGYSFRGFSEADQIESQKPQVFLRHDVDFSLQSALRMANVEYIENIKTTYFIQLRSPLYNALSQYTRDLVGELHGLGHEIALHLDLGLYRDNYVNGVRDEIKLLIACYPFADPRVISFHRPRGIEELRKLRLPNVRHTYEQRFFGDIEYISDSTGAWRHDHPLSSQAFQSKRSMQLVTHPLWWMMSGQTSQEKFGSFIAERRTETVEFLRQTVSFGVDL